jgi:outer membrane protein assembly factor BamB
MKKECSRCHKQKDIPDDGEICRACNLRDDLQKWIEQRPRRQLGTEQSAHLTQQVIVSVPPTLSIADPVSIDDLRGWIEQRRQQQLGTEQSAQAGQGVSESVPSTPSPAEVSSAQAVASATSTTSSANSFVAPSSSSFSISGSGTVGATPKSSLLALIKGPVVHVLLASLVFVVPAVLGPAHFSPSPVSASVEMVGTQATLTPPLATASPVLGTPTNVAILTPSAKTVTPGSTATTRSTTPDPIVTTGPITPGSTVTPSPTRVPPVGGGPTVMFRIDAAHTGYKPGETKIDEGNVQGLHELWRYQISPRVRQLIASPIVAGGVVYIESDTRMYAFDALQCRKGCQPLWYHSWGTLLDRAVSTPAIADGIVYVGAYDHGIYAFDVTRCRQTGGECMPLWTYKTGNYVAASPTVVNGVLYIGSTDHIFYAFDTVKCRQIIGGGECQPLWSYPTNGTITSSAAADSERVYVGSWDHNVYAFNLSCREGCVPRPDATYHADGQVFAAPALANGRVYITSQADINKPVAPGLYNTMFAFSAGCSGDCQPLWIATSTTGGNASPAIANGRVYFGQTNGWLYVFDADVTSCPQQECQPLWYGNTTTGITGSPLIANGLVFVTSAAKKILVYKDQRSCIPPPGVCKALLERPLADQSQSSPFVEDGVLYFADDDGYLYAYGL